MQRLTVFEGVSLIVIGIDHVCFSTLNEIKDTMECHNIGF